MDQEIEEDMVDVLFFEGKKGIGEELEEKIFKKFLRHHKRNLEVIILISLLVFGIVCGYIGFFNRYAYEFNSQNFLKVTYNILQLFVFQFNGTLPIPWILEIARFLCPIALYVSAALAILRIFHDTIKLILLVVRKNHIVICGLNKRVMELVDDFSYRKKKVVIIEKDKNNENISKAKDLEATVIFGDYADPFMLKKARILRAKYLIVFTPNDYVNIEIVNGVNKLFKKERKDFKCFIHIKDSNLSASQFLPEPQFQVRVFNLYENSARFLFLSNKVNPIIDTWSRRDQVHLLIIGFREMGENIVLRAANLGLYPNGKKFRFTIVDEDKDRLRDNFFYRYRNIKKACDISDKVKNSFWEQIWKVIPFQKLNFEKIETKDFLKLEDFIKNIIQIEEQNITAIFVCFDDKSLAIQYKDCLTSIRELENIPIYVQIDDNEQIVEFPKNFKIYPFGLIKNSCCREFIINEDLDLIAKAIHDNFRNDQLEKGKTEEEKPSIRPWEKLANRYKNSNRLQADHNLIKLKTIGYRIDRSKGKKHDKFEPPEIKTLAQMEHNRWCAEQLIYVKNLETEKHRDLKPFDDLDKDEQDKDFGFVENIPNTFSLIKTKNFVIQRGSNRK